MACAWLDSLWMSRMNIKSPLPRRDSHPNRRAEYQVFWNSSQRPSPWVYARFLILYHVAPISAASSPCGRELPPLRDRGVPGGAAPRATG